MTPPARTTCGAGRSRAPRSRSPSRSARTRQPSASTGCSSSAGTCRGWESTPFDPGQEEGWEDRPDQPRSAAELVEALESTYAIIDRVLDAWTPEALEVEFERWYADTRQVHTRTSVLQRLLTHDAYH